MNSALLLFWSILNIAACFGFLYLMIRATRFIHKRAGSITSAIFLITVFSVTVHAGNGDKGSGSVKKWEFAPENKSGQKVTDFMSVNLEKNISLDYTLNISYQLDEKNHINTPISASSYNAGFISGTNWKPMNVTVNAVANKFIYAVDGINEWQLLGITLYAQPKHFEGTATVTRTYIKL